MEVNTHSRRAQRRYFKLICLHRQHFLAVIPHVWHPKRMCAYCINEFLSFDFHYMQIGHFPSLIHHESHLYRFHGAFCWLACWALFPSLFLANGLKKLIITLFFFKRILFSLLAKARWSYWSDEWNIQLWKYFVQSMFDWLAWPHMCFDSFFI